MISLADFHFLRPWWFLALLPALTLLIILWRRRSEGGSWREVCDSELLPHLLLEAGGRPHRLPLLLLAIGWLLAVTALSGPVWERQPQPLFQMALSRVVLLDLSPSMNAQDLKPSRLERARFKLQDILEKSREGRAALVVFAGEPHLVTPLTDDTETIAAMVPVLSVDIVPAEGDSLLPALTLAEELLARGGGGGEILLISDGVSDLAGSLPLAAQMRDRGVRLSVLGVGTAEGAPVPGSYSDDRPEIARLDRSGLNGLAGAGGGVFTPITADGRDLELLLATDANRSVDEAERQQSGIERWLEQGPWLLLPLLLLVSAGFRRGWLTLFFVTVMLPPVPAHALEWSDLWSRPDQKAAAALAAGDAATAATLFQQPDWRAAAHYQAGDYAGAAEALAAARSGDALYNRGNALAKSGALEQALESYDAALKVQPGNKDALFNKQLLEELLRQQQKKEQGEGAGGSRDENGERPQQDKQGEHGEGEQNESKEQSSPADSSTGEKEKTNASQSDEGSNENSADGKQHSQEEDESAAQEHGNADSPDSLGREEQNETSRDSAAAARRDVEPSKERGKPTEKRHGIAGDQSPLKERDLALEQWLRQVPDDPAGLLRRKFMLEHLQRQRGEE
ncbi:MAG: VWA domain-containing protein [Candidatus Sedimenticola sp. (ex Thyasira tokunagai)]